MRTLRLVCILLLLFCITGPASSNHIVGNEVNYKYLSINADSTIATYLINCSIYRDALAPQAAPLDSPAAFGLYQMQPDSSWLFYNDYSIRLDSTGIVQFSVDTCINLNDLEVEIGYYSFMVDIPMSEGTFLLSYQRCCRSQKINNLIKPGDTGFTFNLTFSENVLQSKNSSPIFNRPYPIYACISQQLEIDQSAIDIDGDELRYSFCAPLQAGAPRIAALECQVSRPAYDLCPPSFEEVNYQSPYSAEQPLGTGVVFQIDPITGIITGNPDVIGKYAIGICVEEYRNGELYGKYIRDVELNIISCELQPETTFYYDSDGDGFGTMDSIIVDCINPNGYSANADDCDDTDPNINPDAEEIPNNGIDEDCDGFDLMSSTDELKEDQFTFYPNPANEYINIIHNGQPNYPTIEIYSSTGQLMIQKENKSQIDISNLESGIYLLHWKDESVSGFQKFIKKYH